MKRCILAMKEKLFLNLLFFPKEILLKIFQVNFKLCNSGMPVILRDTRIRTLPLLSIDRKNIP